MRVEIQVFQDADDHTLLGHLVQAEPTSDSYLINLGWTLARLGRYEESIQNFHKALRIHGADELGNGFLAEVLVIAKDPALRNLDEAWYYNQRALLINSTTNPN